MLEFVKNNVALISSLAFVLAVSSFVYAFFRDRSQNKRWDAINTARIVIRNLRLATWRTLPRVEFQKTKWGYADFIGIANVDEDGNMDIDRIRLPIQVIAFAKSGERVNGTNATTLEELQSVLRDKGHDPSSFYFCKLFRIVFVVTNSGGTRARNILLDIQTAEFEPLSEKANHLTLESLEPGESTWSATTLTMPIEKRFPELVHMTIDVTFNDVHDRQHHQTLSFELDKFIGTFRRT